MMEDLNDNGHAITGYILSLRLFLCLSYAQRDHEHREEKYMFRTDN
jgi:hypothetical protein